MNKKTLLNTLIFSISIIALIGAAILSYEEIKKPGFCPTFFIVPVCYIVTFLYSLIVISTVIHNVKISKVLFLMGAGTLFTIALYASISQFMGFGSCPKGFNSFPLCYISFFIVSLLIVLKVVMNSKCINKKWCLILLLFGFFLYKY